jgi:hypothetical protein
VDLPKRFRQLGPTINRGTEIENGLVQVKKKNSISSWLKEKIRERRVRKPKKLPGKPTSRVWWADASVPDREKALKKSFGFKTKDARYLAQGSFSDVFGDRNPSLKGTSTMATKKKAKKRKPAKRKKAVRRRKPTARRNSRPRRRTAPRKPVTKRRRRRAQNSRRKPARITWPFPVTPQQKKKLAPWLGRITGRKVRVK